MDCSDEGSDSELGASGFADFRANMDNLPSTNNILKPQIDRIFSEVQKNLPTIDFDSSDVSSDNDEPIFFHQNLKLNSLNTGFDDDKDLDTSLSQGDAHSLGLGSALAAKDYGTTDALTGTEENLSRKPSSMVKQDDDDMFSSVYDNDLAALMTQVKFPSADDIVSWQKISLRQEREEEQINVREEEDLQRFMTQRSGTTFDAGSYNTSRTGYSSHDREISCQTDDDDISVNDITVDISTSTSTDTNNLNLHLSDSPSIIPSPESSHTEKGLQEELQYRMLKELRDDRKQALRQQARSKDQQIVSSLTPEQQTHLNFRMFEELDLDSILNAASESNVSLDSLRVVGHPTESQLPKSHDGGGDRKGATGQSEELTLMQKLAQLSMTQRGAEVMPAVKLDPKTGNPLLDPKDSRLIYNQLEEKKQEKKETTSSPMSVPAVKSKFASCGTGPDSVSSSSSSQTGSGTSNMGTSTTSGVGKAKILYGRLQHEKREVEPPTVFIDLRGFEQKKQEEKQGLQSVQRVLGLQGMEESSSSEDDDDEEEMVERCNWRQTRQQLKQNLSEQGPSAAATVLRHDGKDSQAKGRPLGYTKPPRVINLQEHATSRKWARRPGQEIDRRVEGRVEGENMEEEEEGVDEEGRRRQEEDNKARQEKLEAEREKERLREKARQLREEREKEREKRMRMSKQVEAARSTASTQGKQSAGENTPALFDIEVSYEPAPSTLPPNLQPETETILLTIHLASNGEIVQHRKRSNRSVDTGNGLSATYTALLSWLLSLVPHDFSFLGGKGSNSSAQGEGNSGCCDSTFNVLGLQQTWQDEELKLNVIVSPSEKYLKAESGVKFGSRSSKGKSDQIKGSSKFGQYLSKFLSVNTLYTVCPWLDSLVSVTMKSERAEEKAAPAFHYTPLLPDISTQPLATFIQMNPDPQAAKKIFNIPVGFYWQTVDTGEAWHASLDCRDSGVCYETQNTMSLVYNKIFHNPPALMAILNRVSQEGLDLAGVRLLYPSANMLAADHPTTAPTNTDGTTPHLGPVLGLALRGTFARSIWLDAVGPSDPNLARRTDPNSLCAQFGGESRESALLFCPRNPSRVQSELTRWFGGRVTEGAASIDVGIPYTKKDETRTKKKGKKGSTPASTTSTISSMTTEPHRPPASLSATCKSDVLLVLSPLLPPSYLGVVMATAQRRGFQVRGVRRVRLTARLANSLGIKSGLQSLFCPGARLEEYQGERPVEALAPCTVFLLRKENAAHNTPSLIEAFMVQLTLAGLLGCVQMRLDEPLTSQHLFQACTFSDGILAALGGDMAKSPDLDLSHMRLGSAPSLSSNKKGVEQMAVVILLGHEMLKKCGVITSKLLNVLPYSSKAPVAPVLPDRPELLGAKWSPGLSMHQAKELSPYEVGDRRWRGSVRQLASEPAFVLALRGVDLFTRLQPVIEQQQQDSSAKRVGKSAGTSQKNRPEVLMSHTASESDIYARLFFHPNELYPDPLARSLLPFLPEARLYFNIVDTEADSGGPPTRVFSLKPPEELDLMCEKVLEEVMSGQQPISTLLLVKPQAASRFLSRVLRKVTQEQFKVVGLRMLQLSTEQAEKLVPASQKQDNSLVQQHISALTCGPSLVLALQSPGAVKRLLDLLGPEDPLSARRLSQFLWRGEFGRDVFNNGLYCSSSYIDAVEDLQTFFPDGLCSEESELLEMEQISAPAEDSQVGVCSNLQREVKVTVTSPSPMTGQGNETTHNISVQDIHQMLQQTTCLVLTPRLTQARFKGRDVPAVDVLAMLLNNGFELVGARLVWLTQRQAETFLAVRGTGSFQQVGYLCSGPCLVLALQRDNAVLAFDAVLNQSSESLRLMKEHGDFILRPSTVKQAHSLLAFFFDHLMPSSQLTIQPVTSRDSDHVTSRDNTTA